MLPISSFFHFSIFSELWKNGQFENWKPGKMSQQTTNQRNISKSHITRTYRNHILAPRGGQIVLSQWQKCCQILYDWTMYVLSQCLHGTMVPYCHNKQDNFKKSHHRQTDFWSFVLQACQVVTTQWQKCNEILSYWMVSVFAQWSHGTIVYIIFSPQTRHF